MATKPPRILRDLRWAYKHSDDGEKTTPERERFRSLAQKDVKAFMTLLERHERAWQEVRASKVKEGEAGDKPAAPVVAADEPLERLIEKAEQWLMQRGLNAQPR
jgi:hypothetical protein